MSNPCDKNLCQELREFSIELAELRKGGTTGEGPKRLAEKRRLAEEEEERKEQARRLKEADALTYGEFFKETYLPQAKANKSWRSWSREDQLHRLWIDPVIGEKPLKTVSQLDLERIKKNMADAGRAPRSIHYCLAAIRQVFNLAKTLGRYQGDNPVSKVKKPKVDNRRLRFLTRDEADRLLEELKGRSIQLYNIAILSLDCGLRAGEIFGLTWADIDLDRGVIMIRDPKGGRNRAAYMTERVISMLNTLPQGDPGSLVFPDRKGKKIKEISNSFALAVNEIDLNDGVTDKRYEVCFHILRHTYASWLVESGTDLYVVKKLMGHSTLAMTERYSHLSDGALRECHRRWGSMPGMALWKCSTDRR